MAPGGIFLRLLADVFRHQIHTFSAVRKYKRSFSLRAQRLCSEFVHVASDPGPKSRQIFYFFPAKAVDEWQFRSSIMRYPIRRILQVLEDAVGLSVCCRKFDNTDGVAMKQRWQMFPAFLERDGAVNTKRLGIGYRGFASAPERFPWRKCLVWTSLPITTLLVNLRTPPLEVLHPARVDETKEHHNKSKCKPRVQRRR